MIKPTVGRMVWFYQFGQTQVDMNEQPMAAIIAHVVNDGIINIAYFDANGAAHNQTGVRLVQEGDIFPPYDPNPFCVWMPYQIGQAKNNSQQA